MKWLNELFNSGTNVLTSEQKQQNTKETIEQIHHEFATAGDKLLQDSLDILEEESKKDVAKGQALEAIGFKSAKQVKEAKESITISTEAKAQAEMINSLKRQYPNYKFITKENVRVINEKYNLVLGTIDQYTGFVPKKNLEDIETFFKKHGSKYRYEPGLRQQTTRITGIKFTYDHQRDQHEKNLKRILKNTMSIVPPDMDPREYVKSITGHIDVRVESIPASTLLICAPAQDMSESKHKVAFSTIPDPVVLYPINDKGYLIVTAWGDEASDELIVNQDLN